MSKLQLMRSHQVTGTVRALLLSAAIPAFLLTAGCSQEAPKPAKSTTQTSKDLAGLGYVGGDGPSAEEVAAEVKQAQAASHDDHNHPAETAKQAAHDEGGSHDDHDHPEETTAKVAASSIPAGHSADDGHGHGADDGHGHGADDGHGHGADDGHGHGAEPRKADLGVDEVAKPAEVDHDNGPRLTYELGMEKHEFGHLMEGSVAEHTFELSNTGTEDLIIKQVKPTCGCTVAEVFAEGDSGEMERYAFGDPIPVGRKVHFPAKLHTKNKSGHQNTRINIFSNDPRGTIQLGLVADVDPFFNISPRFLNFGQVSVGDVVVQKATISSAKGEALALEFVDQSMPAGAKVELLPVDPDSEGQASRWELTVTVGPDLIEGSLARSLVVKSDRAIPGADLNIDGSPATYQATITLSAQVVGPFSFSPPYLSMGLVRPGQVQVRTVQVESHDDEFSFATNVPVVRVVGLQNPGTDTFREWEYADKFTPTVRPVEGKNAVDIELRLEGMPDDATGSFRGTLLVELGHKDKKQIALVITGVCRGGPR